MTELLNDGAFMFVATVIATCIFGFLVIDKGGRK